MDEIVLGRESDAVYDDSGVRLSSTRLNGGKKKKQRREDDGALRRRASTAALIFGAEGLGEDGYGAHADPSSLVGAEAGGPPPAAAAAAAPTITNGSWGTEREVVAADLSASFRREFDDSGMGIVYLDSDSEDEAPPPRTASTGAHSDGAGVEQNTSAPQRRAGSTKHRSFKKALKGLRRERSLSAFRSSLSSLQPRLGLRRTKSTSARDLEVEQMASSVVEDRLPRSPIHADTAGLRPGESLVERQASIGKFVRRPLPPNRYAVCTVVRGKQVVSGRRIDAITMHLQLHDGNQLALVALRKVTAHKISFAIAESLDSILKGRILGKLKGKFMSTVYKLYDDGRKPSQESTKPLRKLFGEIRFVPRARDGGPRQLVVNLVPQNTARTVTATPLQPQHTDDDNGDDEDEDTFRTETDMSFAGERPKHLTLINAQPEWDEERGAYALKFNGRATVASVKNFQLVRDKAGSASYDVLYQFGKIDKDRFNMDFRAPFTPLQAFAVALANLEGTIRESFA